ncbi:S8 family serine peptidase [Actinophytocola sediminis]
MDSRWSPRFALITAVATAATLTALTGPVAAEPAPTAPPAIAGTVTLVTGDRVTLDTSSGRPVTVIEPAGGEDVGATFTTLTQDGDAYVIPDDVAHLVPDVLELDLFNVSALVEMGYTDERTDTLPLIVRGATQALSAAEDVRALPSIDATAVALPKNAADAFADTLTTARAAGVRKVWLDRPVKAAELDWNLDAIGTPTAWESGLTGAGVDVAVLDTGVDAGHPDLAGKVAEEANFTDDPTAEDGNGHGTHVASIVGGTGAVADGARKGVAFDARLLSGKVLNAEGRGQQSWVINGMEWASAKGADVVNLSLGATAQAGDDPVVESLERLTNEHGTLFVVAAGNFGPGPGTVDSPGVAESALTVGNANANGTPVYNSANGPTRGASRTKPDLTAPGVGIIAARAGGGSADPYVAMTGTSMAAPHVAGAAALLRQQHPDWNWRDIKNTLMTTADAKVAFPAPNAEGAGLLDLPDATTETLRYDRSNVDFQFRRWPEGQQRASQQVTITNTGAAPESLTFTDTAKNHWNEQAPETMFTVEPAELTIAPGASGTITVTVDPAVGTPGIYGGLVTVTRQGKENTTLPLNATVEAPRRDVRLTVLDRRGQPWAGGTVVLGNVDQLAQRYGGGIVTVQLDENGQATARVAPGAVSMIARVETPAHGDEPASVSLTGYSEVTVTSDVEVTIDARKALPVKPATVAGASTEVQRLAVHYAHRDAVDNGTIGSIIYAPGADVENGGVFVEPTDPVRAGRTLFQTHWRLVADEGRRPGQADAYEVLLDSPTIPSPPTFQVSAKQVRQMATLVQDYRTVGRDRADFLELRYASTPLVSSPLGFWRERPAPGKIVELVTARPDVQWSHRVVGQVELSTAQNVYQPGQRVVRSWFVGLAPAVRNATQSRQSLHVPVALSDGQHLGNAAPGASSVRLFREGVEVAPRAGNYFDVPVAAAGYRLEHTVAPDREVLPFAARVDTSWTFRSAAPVDSGTFSQPAKLLNIGYEPNTDGSGHLRAWHPLTVDVRLSTTVGTSGPLVGERGTLRFWTSVDGGKRWLPALVLPRADGTFSVISLALPRPGEVVSVRATATGAEGRATTQALIDAYPVR